METLKIPELNPKLSELAEKAKATEATQVNMMEPGQKRRGRPPGSTKKTDTASAAPTATTHHSPQGPSSVNVSSAQIAKPLVLMISKGAGAYVGDKRAEMSVQEMSDVADCFGHVLDKWMPTVAKDFGPELLLAMTLSTYTARVIALKKVLEEDKKKLKEFEKQIDESKGSQPLASQLAINPDLKMQTGLYISPTIGV